MTALDPMSQLVLLLLVLGATYRLTLLLVADEVLDEPRDWVVARLLQRFGPESKLVILVTCPWCMSMYVGAVVTMTALEYGTDTWWQFVAGLLTASGFTGALATAAKPGS